jgi:hypothetical protein
MKNTKEAQLLQTTMVYEEAKKRYADVAAKREKLERALEKAPPGKIHVVKTEKRTQFYLRSDDSEKSGKYISKSDEATIKTHLQKSYNDKVLKLLSIESVNLEKFLKHSDGMIQKIRNVFSDNPQEVKNCISPIDVSDEDYADKWLSTPYTGKAINDQLPFFETNKKERVRSKSELNIANALFARNIPYKYERPLQLNNGNIIHPDFTMLNVKTRKEIFWEHRGMMDDRQYATQSVLRLKEMMKNGIFLGDNLIITEETSANPLGTNEIEMVIEKYFG